MINDLDRPLAITPDGTRVFYIGNNGTQLFARTLDQLEPRAIATGTGPRGVFVSPDGQWVGFFDGASTLKKVAITGGPAVTLAQIKGGSRGAAWAPDDTIILGEASPATALQRWLQAAFLLLSPMRGKASPVPRSGAVLLLIAGVHHLDIDKAGLCLRTAVESAPLGDSH